MIESNLCLSTFYLDEEAATATAVASGRDENATRKGHQFALSLSHTVLFLLQLSTARWNWHEKKKKKREKNIPKCKRKKLNSRAIGMDNVIWKLCAYVLVAHTIWILFFFVCVHRKLNMICAETQLPHAHTSPFIRTITTLRMHRYTRISLEECVLQTELEKRNRGSKK